MSDAVIASISDAAIASILTSTVTVVTLVVGFLTMWVKLKYGEQQNESIKGKIDENTLITQSGARAVTVNAQVAADTARAAAASTRDLSNRLNGGLDQAIAKAIAPIQKVFTDHVEQNARDSAEVNDKLSTLMTQMALLVRSQPPPSQPQLHAGNR